MSHNRFFLFSLNGNNGRSFNWFLRTAYFSDLSPINENKLKTEILINDNKVSNEKDNVNFTQGDETKRDLSNENTQITLKPDLETSQLSNTLEEIINKSVHDKPFSSEDKIYHLHAYCSDNNTIVTLTDLHYNPVISLTSGMVGFKKSQRGGYEAGYRVCVSLFERMIQKNIRPTQLEIILRGFGKGREAIFKCINGMEGQSFRRCVSRITDATRIKFGGVRGRKVRRV